MSTSGGASSLPRRRNGKEQACEPCRKAKIACDHSLPVCTRCKRRKLSEKCVYMTAPMTRTIDPDSSSSNGVTRRQSEPISNIAVTFPLTPTAGSSTVVSPSTSVTAVPSLYSRAASSSTSKPRGKESHHPSSSASQGNSKPAGGFFGPTSFSAVFAENRENLGGSDDITLITNERVPYIPSNESLQAQMYQMLAGKTELVGEPRMVFGSRVLLALPDENTCNFLLEWYFEKCNDARSYKRTTMAVAASLWGMFGKEMKDRRVEDAERVSEVICKNVTIPLEESDDWETWISSITGENMRWESIGCIFQALTSALLSLPERDCFFTTQRSRRADRKHFAVEMKDCLQACITLSNYMDFLNILMVALLYRNYLVQTVITGDTSLVCWRQLGDLVSATTALGLHRQVANRHVTFLSEFKKYVFSIVFGIDKSASLLTGRPPALSYRYTRFELPLDLDDDVVIRGGEELQNAIAALDANGWNTDGVIYASTRCRGHVSLSIVLNEILELSLGNPADATEERIAHLLTRLNNTYDEFPNCLRLNLSDDTGTDIDIWCRLNVRLHTLEHRLILERLAHKQGVKDGQTMIDCAREMLELVVLLWVQRDRFVEKHCDYDWMLMCWGVPSSGVLCVELLKQMKQPLQPQANNLLTNSNGISSPPPVMLKLPRSEIVQNLSLLIGFLEWVRPAAGNYLLCRRMSLLIKRILDQILNPSPPSSNPPAPSQDSIQTDGFDTASSANGIAMSFDPTAPTSSASGAAGVNGAGVGAGGIGGSGIGSGIGAGMGGMGGAFGAGMTGTGGGFDQLGMGHWEEGLNDLDWLNTVDWSRGPWRADLGGQDFTAAARWT